MHSVEKEIVDSTACSNPFDPVLQLPKMYNVIVKKVAPYICLILEMQSSLQPSLSLMFNKIRIFYLN